MSKFRNSRTGDDYPEAATKHLDDASVLFDAKRFDGAAYLSGYVVECALKSLILLGQGRPWGHDLKQLSIDASRLAALPGSISARYASLRLPGQPVPGWRETLRYDEALARFSVVDEVADMLATLTEYRRVAQRITSRFEPAAPADGE